MLRGTHNASQLATIRITGANWQYPFIVIWGLIVLHVLVNWLYCKSTLTDSHVHISLSKFSNSGAKVVRNLVGNSEGWEWDSIMQKHVFASSSCLSHSSTNQTGSRPQPIKASPLIEQDDRIRSPGQGSRCNVGVWVASQIKPQPQHLLGTQHPESNNTKPRLSFESEQFQRGSLSRARASRKQM